ncbi:Dolichyl-phosphate beta-glucosyltransferase [Smittium mucronatum]|uniref:dolichyl-phosphate beta-glucosyltransferase n=1 Tax=Smittium mucronatum TaxID=133383 RepID=A0A1R0GVX5_9FUNG|nr:Dolichyl-phosphate beta-glucosyltransferase [Smittium mucronatum]
MFMTVSWFQLFLIVSTLFISTIIAVIIFWSPNPRKSLESEGHYLSHDSKDPKKLPKISDKPEVFLSIIVPAYNEELRLPLLLDDIREYMTSLKNKISYEIIIVNDASKDNTVKIALEYGKKHSMPIKVKTNAINRGKGGSVTQGILSSSGEYILFCDADGATRFSDIDVLLATSKKISANDLSVCVGSRAFTQKVETVVHRSPLRSILQYCFHQYVYLLGVRGVKDTQCGFKLFSRAAANLIFTQMHVEGFIFDIEVLLLARYYNIPIAEVPVNWNEVDGSKMSIVYDSIHMALDLLAVRLNYLLGFWTIRNTNSKTEKSSI